MKLLDRSATRGKAEHGWLHSRHTFSFADYHNPERMGFGLLRVLNDDVVAASMGFSTHPHKNMEIISIPLSGSLRHEDSMGNKHVITAGEIQVMSAGTGITHSEYNNSAHSEVNFLQIWILPQQLNIQPRYDQKAIDASDKNNCIQLIAAPMGTPDVVNINQQAYFSLAEIDATATLKYIRYHPQHGVYFFVIAGQLKLAGEELSHRDGIGLTDVDNIEVTAVTRSRLLCIEVPMK